MSTFQEVSSIKEKTVAIPDRPIADRAFIRFDCDNQSFADGEFNQLRFKVDAPSTRSIFRNTRIVLPMSFKFKTRQGKSVFRPGIAPKGMYMDRVFRSVEININGQSYMQSPLEKLVHRYVSSSTSLKFEPDGGSMLPILPKDDVAIPYHNYSFEQRCKEFAQCWNASTQSYEFDLEIFLDGGPLSAFIRGQEANGNLAIPYCFNMDITVQFDQSFGKTDTQSVQGRLGQTCWKHCFDIQQPVSKLAVEREGLKLKPPHLRCKDVTRVLILDEGYETRVEGGANPPVPATQPGFEMRFVNGNPLGEAGIPRQGANTEIHILGAGLFRKVEEWLAESNHPSIADRANRLWTPIQDLAGGQGQRKYYLGWFRVGASEQPQSINQMGHESTLSTRVASFLDSQATTVADETHQDRDPSSFSAPLHGVAQGHGQPALRLAEIARIEKGDAQNGGGEIVPDIERLVVQLTRGADEPAGNVFGIANSANQNNGRVRYERQVMHRNGYRWCLLEAPISPAVSSSMTLVARGLSAHEDRGPDFEQRIKEYPINTQADALALFTKPKAGVSGLGFCNVAVFGDDNNTAEAFVAGAQAGPRLDTAGNEIPQTVSKARARTNLGQCSNDLWKAWYFSDSVVRFANASRGNIKLNGLLDRRHANLAQEFLVWADKDEQSAIDENEEVIVIAQEPEQVAHTTSDIGFLQTKNQVVNVNGIYKPKRTPFGLLCPYSQATSGLNGTYLKGDLTHIPLGDEQQDFRCGDVTLIPYREPEPIVAIDAKYQPGRRPHISCEVVLHENMKRQYMLDDYRMERHRFPEPLRIQDIVSGKRIFFSDLRINEVPSCVYLLACIDPEQLDLELCTSGLADCLLSTLRTRVQVNNTIAFDFTDSSQEYSLYEMFARACPRSNISYQCFKDRRPLLAFKPEELAVDEFQAGRFQISNLNIETVLELSPSWRRILQRAGTAKSHLATRPHVSDHYYTRYEESNKLLPYLQDLPIRVELVVEYSNYMLQVDDTGKTTRVLNRLPAIGESGFEFRNPRPAVQTLDTPSFVELGK